MKEISINILLKIKIPYTKIIIDDDCMFTPSNKFIELIRTKKQNIDKTKPLWRVRYIFILKIFRSKLWIMSSLSTLIEVYKTIKRSKIFLKGTKLYLSS